MRKVNHKLIIVILLASLIIFGGQCASTSKQKEKIDLSKILLVKNNETIPENICNKIQNRTIIIEKAGCPACAVAIPIIKEVEKELNLNFEYFDIADKKEREELFVIGVAPYYVPAIFKDCRVYIGVYSKEQYTDLFKK